MEIRNIIVFRTGQLGDTLISMPAISLIRQRHPNHRLVLLTERQAASLGYVSSWDVLGPTGWFNEVMFYVPTKNLLQRIRTMLSLSQRIRALHPEIIYDIAPERAARQSKRDRFFFQILSGVKKYYGSGLLIKPPKDQQGLLRQIEPEWKRLLRVVDAETDAVDFHLPIPESEKRQAHESLVREGLNEDIRILAVGPGSKMPAKKWAKDRYRELGRRLLTAYPALHLVVVGGKEDTAIGEELCAAWGKRSHNLAGRLSLYGSAAVLARSIAYVGNDTGTMHLAGMVGISCVALFSARDYPGQWVPYGTGHQILRHETECSGCMRVVCPYDNKCLGLISIDEVESAVCNVIAS